VICGLLRTDANTWVFEICHCKLSGWRFTRGYVVKLGFKSGENKLCNFSNNNDLPPDELNRIPASILNRTIQDNNNNDNISSVWDFGFPYCYGDSIPDPSFPNYETNCVGTVPSVASLGQTLQHN